MLTKLPQELIVMGRRSESENTRRSVDPSTQKGNLGNFKNEVFFTRVFCSFGLLFFPLRSNHQNKKQDDYDDTMEDE